MSCSIGKQAFYVSPFNGISTRYHTIPLQSDSIKASTFINSSLSIGGDNEGRLDNKYSFSTGLSRSHNVGNFQGWYGAALVLGSYNMKRYDSIGNNATVNYKIINQNAGNHFFGGVGFDGGINFVHSFNNGEWRVMGVETSLQNEFGNYQEVRKNLPDSAATLIIKDRFFGTAGLFSEIAGKSGETIFGAKFGGGIALGSRYRNSGIMDTYFLRKKVSFHYFNFTLHYTKQKWTGYFQSTFTSKSNNALLGANFRIGK